MSDHHEEPRTEDDQDAAAVQELTDDALDAVSGGKEAAMNQIAPGG